MIRFLRRPLKPLHRPHTHECRTPNCPNTQTCQDADRCRTPDDWICGSCADALEQQELEAMAAYHEREQAAREKSK